MEQDFHRQSAKQRKKGIGFKDHYEPAILPLRTQGALKEG